MIMRISQINNEIAVIIPPAFVQSLNLDNHSQVDIRLENNCLQILPITNEKTPTTENSTSITASVAKVGGILSQFTDKKLTVQQMNDGIAKHFSQLNKPVV